MVVEALVALRHPGCYTEEVRGDARVVHLTAGPDASLLIASAPDPRELDHVVATFARVNGRPHEIVERTPLTCVIRFTSCEGSIVRKIFACGGSVVWPAIFRDGVEHYTVLARTRATLAGIVQELGKVGEVRVTNVKDVAGDAIGAASPSTEFLSDLTPRQLAILLHAVERGYYRAPRETDAASLARELGIAPSTIGEHLRKAEARVLERFAASIDDQPALRHAATRKRGRPPRARGR